MWLCEDAFAVHASLGKTKWGRPLQPWSSEYIPKTSDISYVLYLGHTIKILGCPGQGLGALIWGGTVIVRIISLYKQLQFYFFYWYRTAVHGVPPKPSQGSCFGPLGILSTMPSNWPGHFPNIENSSHLRSILFLANSTLMHSQDRIEPKIWYYWYGYNTN